MNIFVLDSDPVIAAQSHCDRHAVKMILETGQMLSTAQRFHGNLSPEAEQALYRSAYLNHPCTVWVRQTAANYTWAYTLFESLLAEYTHRYEKVHASSRLVPFLRTVPSGLQGELTPFALAMPDDCKGVDAIESYREYYRRHKASFARWTKRQMPNWFEGQKIATIN